MAVCATVIELLVNFVSGVSEGLITVKHATTVLLNINHTFMSKVMSLLVCLCNTVHAGISVLLLTIYTVLVCILEFGKEFVNFAQAFLYLFWKLILLFANLLDLLFHVAESVMYFLWTGGKWTASTVTKSAQTLSGNGVGTWKYFVISLKEFTDSVIGGFTVIGQLTKSSIYCLSEMLSWLLQSVNDVFQYTDNKIRSFIFYSFEFTCHVINKYILGLSRDTYVGILICLSSYILLSKIYRRLCSQGITFSLFPFYPSHTPEDALDVYYDDYEGRMAEFSDDDYVDLSQDDGYSENDEEDDVSEGDTLDNSYDEVSDVESELEVDSSDESGAASESELSEINIQLPNIDENYDLRRSVTPSRTSKGMTTRDLERLIENEKERRKCVVCQDQNKSVLILPCKHMCLCVRCGDQIARSRIRERRICPLCRKNIKTIMDVYV